MDPRTSHLLQAVHDAALALESATGAPSHLLSAIDELDELLEVEYAIRLPDPLPAPRHPVAALPPVTGAVGAILFSEVSGAEPDVAPHELLDLDRESSACRALLLEVLRRAAYDWVLYRQSSKLDMRGYAMSAYNWLFEEEPGTEEYVARVRAGKELTAFVSICELLDMDPDNVRNHVRKLTSKDVVSVGRPAEQRHPTSNYLGEENEAHVSLAGFKHYDPIFGG